MKDKGVVMRIGVGLVAAFLIVVPAGKGWCDPVKDYEIALAKGQYEIELRNYEQAITYLKKALELKPDDHASMTALGIAYSRHEEYPPAKELLEKVVAADPQNTRAQYELGVVLAHLKQYGEANKLLATVSASAGSEELADNAKELMEGMRPPKEAGKPVLRIVGGLQYDSNVILEPDNPYVSQGRQADWRGVLSLFGSYPFLNRQRGGAEVNYQFYQSLHFELEDYNVQQHDLSLSGRYAFSPNLQGSLQAGAIASFVGGERYGSTFVIRPALNTSLLEDSRTQFTVGWEQRKYSNSSEYPTNEDRSGSAVTAGVSHTQSLTKETSVVFEYGYEQEYANEEWWDSTAHRLAATARSSFGKFSVFASASAADRQYGASPLPFYPDRHDRRWDATVGMFRDLTRTIRLSLADQYVVNDSNLDVYKYRRDILGLFVEIRL